LNGRGRPRADRVALLEKVVALLVDDPSLSANRVQFLVEANRAETLRVVRAARTLLGVDPCPKSGSDSPSPSTRFQKPQRGVAK
jgi:hypothetical protein